MGRPDGGLTTFRTLLGQQITDAGASQEERHQPFVECLGISGSPLVHEPQEPIRTCPGERRTCEANGEFRRRFILEKDEVGEPDR